MSKRKLQTYIHKNVPLTKDMGLRVIKADFSGVELNFPLKPNRNHLNTAFGGSLIGGEALACWAWVTHQLWAEELSAEVVLKDCQSQFLGPVKGQFKVFCPGLGRDLWAKFLKNLKTKGRSRLNLESVVYQGGLAQVKFQGRYVAMAKGAKL